MEGGSFSAHDFSSFHTGFPLGDNTSMTFTHNADAAGEVDHPQFWIGRRNEIPKKSVDVVYRDSPVLLSSFPQQAGSCQLVSNVCHLHCSILPRREERRLNVKRDGMIGTLLLQD